jgi:stearoyl-CoA desaturase (delta-9 desaturase)
LSATATGTTTAPAEHLSDAPPEFEEPRNGQKAVMVGITVIPFIGVIAAISLLWNQAIGWSDLLLFGVLYVCCGLGVTVGFHRMLTHRAFEAKAPLKAALLMFGSMAIQGKAIDWAVDHRTHHAFSDRDGDPHSPHHGFADTIGGQLRGLLHAHVGWMFDHHRQAERERYAKDLLKDPIVVFFDRTFYLWAVMAFAVPFALGYLLSGGDWSGAFTGLLWGGLVRLFFNHHVTWSVNSICHYFGRRPYRTTDLATNNWLLALPSFGESWHHNHHVFPGSAVHGIDKGQLDASAMFIAAAEKLGLATNVRRVSDEQKDRKRGPTD